MKDQSWVTIAKALNTGKTGGQCSQHWTRVANPAIKKGMWDADEEAKLLELQKSKAKRWADMAKELPGRTDIQCRHHFQNLEACANNPWTKEEDRLLEVGQLKICAV